MSLWKRHFGFSDSTVIFPLTLLFVVIVHPLTFIFIYLFIIHPLTFKRSCILCLSPPLGLPLTWKDGGYPHFTVHRTSEIQRDFEDI